MNGTLAEESVLERRKIVERRAALRGLRPRVIRRTTLRSIVGDPSLARRLAARVGLSLIPAEVASALILATAATVLERPEIQEVVGHTLNALAHWCAPLRAA